MKNTVPSKSIAVFGSNWAEPTKRFIETIGLFQNVVLFKYDCRESLFIEQYDFFLMTDFDFTDLQKLDEMRQVVYTRSMKSVIFANIDDVNIAKSLRESSARVVSVSPKAKYLPKAFIEAVLHEYFDPRSTMEKMRVPALKVA